MIPGGVITILGNVLLGKVEYKLEKSISLVAGRDIRREGRLHRPGTSYCWEKDQLSIYTYRYPCGALHTTISISQSKPELETTFTSYSSQLPGRA